MFSIANIWQPVLNFTTENLDNDASKQDYVINKQLKKASRDTILKDNGVAAFENVLHSSNFIKLGK